MKEGIPIFYLVLDQIESGGLFRLKSYPTKGSRQHGSIGTHSHTRQMFENTINIQFSDYIIFDTGFMFLVILIKEIPKVKRLSNVMSWLTSQSRQKYTPNNCLAPIAISKLESLNDWGWQGLQGIMWPTPLFKAGSQNIGSGKGPIMMIGSTASRTELPKTCSLTSWSSLALLPVLHHSYVFPSRLPDFCSMELYLPDFCSMELFPIQVSSHCISTKKTAP